METFKEISMLKSAYLGLCLFAMTLQGVQPRTIFCNDEDLERPEICRFKVTSKRYFDTKIPLNNPQYWEKVRKNPKHRYHLAAGRMKQPFRNRSSNILQHIKPQTRYTVVVTKKYVIFTQVRHGRLAPYTKHAVLAELAEDVWFAGEFWLDDLGKFHVDNNSGSYCPPSTELPGFQRLFAKAQGIQVIFQEFIPSEK